MTVEEPQPPGRQWGQSFKVRNVPDHEPDGVRRVDSMGDG
jgi:hypothetical protein